MALSHRAGDRIPVDFWATGTVFKRLEAALGAPREALLDRWDVDFRYIDGPAYVGPPLEPGADIWGVRRGSVSSGAAGRSESYSEVLQAPLAAARDVRDVEAYPHWPNPDSFDYGVVEAQCRAARKGDRVVVFMGDRLNRIAQLKPAMYLRGAEEIFVDLAIQKDVAQAIFDRIRTFYRAYLERILEAAKGGIDIVLTGDDFGAQNGLLMRAGMWREFLRPGFADYIRLVKRHGAVAMHHTCGSVVEIVPDLIDCGLDVLQSVQPEAEGMSLPALKRRFGQNLCFHGGISIQRTMPYGTPDDVRREVRGIAEAVGTDGGYIFCTSHNIQADTPLENVLALLKAYREHGRGARPAS